MDPGQGSAVVLVNPSKEIPKHKTLSLEVAFMLPKFKKRSSLLKLMIDVLIVNQSRASHVVFKKTKKKQIFFVFVLLLSHHTVSKLPVEWLHNQDKSFFWFLLFHSFFVANIPSSVVTK